MKSPSRGKGEQPHVSRADAPQTLPLRRSRLQRAVEIMPMSPPVGHFYEPAATCGPERLPRTVSKGPQPALPSVPEVPDHSPELVFA